MSDPLDALRAAGWAVEVGADAQGRVYYRARRDGWCRGSHRPAGLLEMCRRCPPGPAPVYGATMKPYYDHGGITIYHGDCREVLPLVAPLKPRLILADPPYGDDHDTDYTRFSGGVAKQSVHERVANDAEPYDPAPLLALGAECILFGANRYSDRLPCGSWLVWDKRSPGGSKNVMSDAEVAWWSKGRGVYIFEHTWDGFNRASERGSKLHPTQKPVALMRWCLMRAGLKRGALVFDPYMGSGPVAQACKELGLRYVGVELKAEYCEAAVNRLLQQPMMFEEAA